MVLIKKYTALVVSIVFAYAVAFLGSLVTTPSIGNWYSSLNKPSFNPPNYLFGPVWTILFTLMAISAYLVWKKKKKITAELKIYAVQLGLNFLWSYLFFGLHRPDLALFEIMLLWVYIALTIVRFYKVDKLAGYLLIPYILWVGFAAFLNYSIVTLN
ncbi:MAG: TspO and MBR like protein [Candidatus Woesebacteria bacterium GW2011_GWA1_45_8]|uniref:TspO and MBR like protein n=1 Tax=Candidatus Woesebacteria bacterium GW2011_GWA1_45_8 TaxID=1618559 RepID=A0A0G1MVU7_9BACT|nr:MAG: TspO and MBR like protein [Candidatus Woesebacteria bacterium GW2011_GWA1_45_8]